jgi:hypothetical protein
MKNKINYLLYNMINKYIKYKKKIYKIKNTNRWKSV